MKALFISITLFAAVLFTSAQVQNPNAGKIPVTAAVKDRPKFTDQQNPNQDNPGSPSRWLADHRASLYEVCRKAVKNDLNSIKLLDQKLAGKSDAQAVDIMTQFLDALLR